MSNEINESNQDLYNALLGRVVDEFPELSSSDQIDEAMGLLLIVENQIEDYFEFTREDMFPKD